MFFIEIGDIGHQITFHRDAYLETKLEIHADKHCQKLRGCLTWRSYFWT